jgi:hypothetical protein
MMQKWRNASKNVVGKAEGKRPVGRPRHTSGMTLKSMPEE